MRILRLAALVLTAGGFLPPIAAGQLPSAPREAARLYDEGDFAGARDRWRALAADPESGLDPAAVEYNLGNAEFRSGALGRAMLHWERALLYRPGDEDALWNLALARGILDRRLQDAASSRPSDAFALELLGSMEGFAADLRRVPPRRLAAALGVVSLASGALVTLLLLGFGRRRLVAAALALSLAGAAVSLALFGMRLSAPPVAVVVEDGASLRSGPAATFPQLAMLPEGFYLELDEGGVEEAGGFRRVVAAGIVGYADVSAAVPVAAGVGGQR